MYMYIIPITPDIDILFRAIIGIVVPYVTYVLLENLYSKRVQIVAVSEKRKENDNMHNTVYISITANNGSFLQI